MNKCPTLTTILSNKLSLCAQNLMNKLVSEPGMCWKVTSLATHYNFQIPNPRVFFVVLLSLSPVFIMNVRAFLTSVESSLSRYGPAGMLSETILSMALTGNRWENTVWRESHSIDEIRKGRKKWQAKSVLDLVCMLHPNWTLNTNCTVNTGTQTDAFLSWDRLKHTEHFRLYSQPLLTQKVSCQRTTKGSKKPTSTYVHIDCSAEKYTV